MSLYTKALVRIGGAFAIPETLFWDMMFPDSVGDGTLPKDVRVFMKGDIDARNFQEIYQPGLNRPSASDGSRATRDGARRRLPSDQVSWSDSNRSENSEHVVIPQSKTERREQLRALLACRKAHGI